MRRHATQSSGSTLANPTPISFISYTRPLKYAHQNQKGSLEKYMNQLDKKDKQKASANIRIKRKSHVISSQLEQDQSAQKYRTKTIKSEKQLDNLRDVIYRKRLLVESSTKDKMDRLISVLSESLSLSRRVQMRPPPINQPIFYPIPMPFSMIPPTNQYMQTLKNVSSKSYHPKMNLLKQKEFKSNRAKANIKRWRKVGNAILFIMYFKQFCNMVMAIRKQRFSEFKKKIRVNINCIRQKNLTYQKPALKLFLLKSQTDFQIQDDESKDIIKEKIKAVRKIVSIILEGLAIFVKQSTNDEEILQTFYFFCKHGNYTCTQQLLTCQQLQLTCISKSFLYVSANSNLQNAALLNVLFVKILLYNIFLAPNKLGQQFQNQTVQNNMLFISNVLYQFIIDYQDAELSKVPTSYKIGNFKDMSFVKTAQSLIISKRHYRQGELISGFLEEKNIKRYFKFQNWVEQKKVIGSILKSIRQNMSRFHIRMIKNYF